MDFLVILYEFAIVNKPTVLPGIYGKQELSTIYKFFKPYTSPSTEHPPSSLLFVIGIVPPKCQEPSLFFLVFPII